MTYDPYRDQDPPRRYRHPRRPHETGPGTAILLAALLLAALGGFIYFIAATGDQTVATNEMRPPITQPSTTGSAPAPETTGSSANVTPAPEPNADPKVKPVE